MSNIKSLTLQVFTPNGLIHEVKNLVSINIPLANGYPIGIHSGHAPLIAGTVDGSIRYRNDDQEAELNLLAGILEVRDDIVIIFTAGKLGEGLTNQVTSEETEFDRLMNTLVGKLQPG